jgi:glycosyltransferase involved in cell wall biosynthesis
MFSVIIPSYNNEKTIGNTLESILSQTWTKFDVLVVDNHSTDKTKKIVKSFNDDRIKFYQIDNGGMPAVSRNYGISLSSSNYLAFCDSDDCWDKNKLAMCAVYVKKGYGFIAHNLRLTGSYSKLVLVKFFQRKPARTFEEFVENGNNIAQSSIVIRRDILDRVGLYSTDAKFIAVEDAHLWCRILRSGENLAYINSSLGSYHYSSTALSFKANQFKANLALRLEYFPNIKPGWYKYNIATYLMRKNMDRRAFGYLMSIMLGASTSIELRLKSFFLLVQLWFR